MLDVRYPHTFGHVVYIFILCFFALEHIHLNALYLPL
uniref:Uncharacterized protein n=1 Tax=Anguilla anguilla TaxID=7936 RepID=A0A0E9UQI7_ANGAN